MFKLVVLVSFVACAVAGTIPSGLHRLPQLDGRIVGGTATTIGSYPYQISLQRSGSHSCGGSIYSTTVIVTAAHCLQSVSASVLKVRAGSTYWNSGGSLISVASFENHSGYKSSTMVNDVAVVRLASALTLSSNIARIGLASAAPASGTKAVVSGWGTTSYGSSSIPTTLQKVDVNIVSLADCKKTAYGNEVQATMICAGTTGKDACQGDSGGPLAANGVLVGIVSWGYGCGYANYPGVYSDVASLRAWIISKV